MFRASGWSFCDDDVVVSQYHLFPQRRFIMGVKLYLRVLCRGTPLPSARHFGMLCGVIMNMYKCSKGPST